MKYIFLNIEVRDGEREYNCCSVHQLSDSADTETWSEDYAQHFYMDDEDTPMEDGGYYLCMGEVHVKVHSVREISKEHYDVLKQYI